MSTAPQSVESLKAVIQERINAAGALLEKRLLPAVLNMKDLAARQQNTLVFNSFAISRGLVGRYSTMTPEQIAAELYAAVVNDVQSATPQLVWQTAPKALLKRTEKLKDPNARQDFRATEDLAKRMAESRKADERIKEQEAAKKRVLGLIAGFSPTKRGILKYALRDEMQKKWNGQVASCKDFTKLESAICADQEKIYAELEAPQRA